MKGRIASFRRGRRTQYKNQMIVQPEADSREAAQKLVGKKVTWTAPGEKKTTITGEVRSAHGGNGAIRVLFEKGMPGQALGSEVSIQ